VQSNAVLAGFAGAAPAADVAPAAGTCAVAGAAVGALVAGVPADGVAGAADG